jgi:hypothetical protein
MSFNGFNHEKDSAVADEHASLIGESNNKYSTDDEDLINSNSRLEDEYEDSTRQSLQSAEKEEHLPIWTLSCILSTSFAYGCIMTTLFLITLPVECQRIEKQNPNVPKSVCVFPAKSSICKSK